VRELEAALKDWHWQTGFIDAQQCGEKQLSLVNERDEARKVVEAIAREADGGVHTCTEAFQFVDTVRALLAPKETNG